jgi:hypothetical protein
MTTVNSLLNRKRQYPRYQPKLLSNTAAVASSIQSASLNRAAARAFAGSAQSLFGSIGHRSDFVFLDERHHDLRVQKANHDLAR